MPIIKGWFGARWISRQNHYLRSFVLLAIRPFKCSRHLTCTLKYKKPLHFTVSLRLCLPHIALSKKITMINVPCTCTENTLQALHYWTKILPCPATLNSINIAIFHVCQEPVNFWHLTLLNIDVSSLLLELPFNSFSFFDKGGSTQKHLHMRIRATIYDLIETPSQKNTSCLMNVPLQC